MFKIGATEQTRHAPAQSSPAQINANAFVIRIAHRVVPRNDARGGHRIAALNCARALILGRRRYHFLTASTIGAGGVLCRINCWFVRAGLPLYRGRKNKSRTPSEA